MVYLFPNPDDQFVCSQLEEDVAFGPENMGLEPGEIKNRVETALTMMSLLDYRDHPPQFLSGGQKQRAALAGLLAMKPACMILDEPTAMLDPRSRRDVIGALWQLKEKEGINIILVTHNLEEAMQADQVIVLQEGKVARQGTAAQVLTSPQELEALGLEVPEFLSFIASLEQKIPRPLPRNLSGSSELVELLCRLR